MTHWFRAPELLLGCKNYGTSIDVCSFGCILAEILGRKPIFPGTDSLNQLKLIINVLGSQKESDLQFIDNPKAQRYVESLTFSKGIQLSDLYPEANPLAIDLLKRILVFDPTKRISVTEALLHPYIAGLLDPKLQPPVHVPYTLDIDEYIKEPKCYERSCGRRCFITILKLLLKSVLPFICILDMPKHLVEVSRSFKSLRISN